jgi:hypothetical protein
MSDRPTRLEIDATTGIQRIVELTDAEIAEVEKAKIAYEQAEAERQADEVAKQALKASAKAKLVAGEPLTEDEAAVLVI